MTIEQILDTFLAFWYKFFPEHIRDRIQIMREVNDAADGQSSAVSDAGMVAYQDRVAAVYGAYEADHFKMFTMQHLLKVFSGRTEPVNHLVSLGCGPASYELYLVWIGLVQRVTLVDQSPAMLARAQAIAQELGILDCVTTIVADATQSRIPMASADMVLSINAMHWSQNWRQWITELVRICEPGGELFLSCSLMLPRSRITAESLAEAVRRYFQPDDFGLVMPPQPVGGGMSALSSRFYVSGKKPGPHLSRRERRKRQRGK